MNSNQQKIINEIIAKERAPVKPGGKFFDKIKLEFDKDYLYFTAEDISCKIKLKGCSDKLYNADIDERLNYV